MLLPFDLSVPSDDRYRSLTPEVAAKYAELAGRPAADAEALGAEVAAAAARLAKPDHNIEVKLTSTADAVNVSLESNGQSATVTSR
jgi:hypothetical protein